MNRNEIYLLFGFIIFFVMGSPLIISRGLNNWSLVHTLPAYINESIHIDCKIIENSKTKKMLSLALEIDPRNSRANSNLGNLYSICGHTKQALAFYNHALSTDPKNFVALFRSAQILHSQGDYDTAITRLILAGDKPGFEALVKELLSQGMHEQIQRGLGKAFEIKGNDPVLFFWYGYISMEIDNDFEEASYAFSSAIEINPYYLDAYRGLTKALIQLNQYDSAFEVSEEMDIKWPNNAFGSIVRAQIYEDQNEIELAINEYELALERVPDCEGCLFLVSGLFIRQGQFEKALSYMEKAIQLSTATPGYYVQLGDIYIALDNRNLALKNYETALGLSPNEKYILEKIDALSPENP